jgi:hypothetical protein
MKAVDDMNPEARRTLKLAREEYSPSDDDKRRVQKALGVALAATAVAGAASTEAAAAAKTAGLLGAWGLRGVASVLLVASAGAGAYWWVERSHVPAPSSVQPAPAAPVATAAEIASPPDQEPRADEPSNGPTPAAASPSERDPQRPLHADPLAAELNLLQGAQQAWRNGNAQQTLELTRQHAAAYPKSQFATERAALQVFALCALGRKVEAHAIAADLLQRSPKSPLRTSLEESCAMK